MEYALLIYNAPDTLGEVSPELNGAYDEWVEYFESVKDAGVFVAAEGLRGADTATTVRLTDGQVMLTDGPFAETKEHLLGFYLIDAPDLDAAVGWASRMPVLRHGVVEIRPVRPARPDVGRAFHRSQG